jgi:hypothetical protein
MVQVRDLTKLTLGNSWKEVKDEEAVLLLPVVKHT